MNTDTANRYGSGDGNSNSNGHIDDDPLKLNKFCLSLCGRRPTEASGATPGADGDDWPQRVKVFAFYVLPLLLIFVLLMRMAYSCRGVPCFCICCWDSCDSCGY